MPRDWVQWAAAILGAVTVALVVGILVVDGAAGDGTPPMPSVAVHSEEGYETPTGWVVPATLTNDGSTAAEAVILVATASVSGSDERSELTVDYAPPGSEVDVAFGFSARPEGEVEVRVVGFRLP